MVLPCYDPRDPYDTYGHMAEQKRWKEQDRQRDRWLDDRISQFNSMPIVEKPLPLFDKDHFYDWRR